MGKEEGERKVATVDWEKNRERNLRGRGRGEIRGVGERK